MKVVRTEQMRHLEAQAYRDGASEIDFMEEAGSGVALVVHDFAELHNVDRTVVLICGKGNNGGDAYVAGIHLLHLDYEVIAYQCVPIDDCSRLCQANYKRFLEEEGRILTIDAADEMILPESGIIIDGLLGTGFTGSIDDYFGSLIQMINHSRLPIIAIDIPSGLEGTTGEAQKNNQTVLATETAFLGLPKTGLFLKDGWDCVGKLRYIDFGLPKFYIEESDSDFLLLTKEDVEPLLPKMKRSRHKYEAGHVIGLAGSPEFPGAAILASEASLESGAGIVHLLYPHGMEAELSNSKHELIKIAYDYSESEKIIDLMNQASAVFIGPGLGRKPETFALLKKILPKIKVPCVIDADALNFLATPEGQKISLPEHTLLTPHRGEMHRLFGSNESPPPLTQQYLDKCLDFASEKGVTILLKGGPTFIFSPDQPIYVSSHGDPGMATAGSGDILTGLIASLLAQKSAPVHAAMLGSYIHGLAGEYAASELTSYCMIASDILYHFPEGFYLGEY